MITTSVCQLKWALMIYIELILIMIHGNENERLISVDLYSFMFTAFTHDIYPFQHRTCSRQEQIYIHAQMFFTMMMITTMPFTSIYHISQELSILTGVSQKRETKKWFGVLLQPEFGGVPSGLRKHHSPSITMTTHCHHP